MLADEARWPRRRKSGRVLILFIAVLFLEMSCVPASYEASGDEDIYINDFQYLSNYGEWFDVPPYGSVWRPFAVADWAPFYYGHWIWTNDGWAWVSYEPFGWLVYHYGSWDFRDEYGWFWMPGDDWSPARVEWYSSGYYCAWAPLPPPNVYWPPPWESFDTPAWIVVEIDRFTDENVGRRKMTVPQPRYLLKREDSSPHPPDIRIIRERADRSLDAVMIRTEPAPVRGESASGESTSIAPRARTFERMVLPRADRRKVEKYSPHVRRDVLTPRKNKPPEIEIPADSPSSADKKSDDEGTKQLKRR